VVSLYRERRREGVKLTAFVGKYAQKSPTANFGVMVDANVMDIVDIIAVGSWLTPALF